MFCFYVVSGVVGGGVCVPQHPTHHVKTKKVFLAQDHSATYEM
jgi:hypothetical protein